MALHAGIDGASTAILLALTHANIDQAAVGAALEVVRLGHLWGQKAAVHRAIVNLVVAYKGELFGVGRRSGEERGVILGYLLDGANLVTLAMNGWADGEPGWWLNLQAHPEVSVQTADGRLMVRGRAAEGDERRRLWEHWGEFDKNMDANAALRSTETAVVVLEPLLKQFES